MAKEFMQPSGMKTKEWWRAYRKRNPEKLKLANAKAYQKRKKASNLALQPSLQGSAVLTLADNQNAFNSDLELQIKCQSPGCQTLETKPYLRRTGIFHLCLVHRP